MKMIKKWAIRKQTAGIRGSGIRNQGAGIRRSGHLKVHQYN
jgi:hypothetical protein